MNFKYLVYIFFNSITLNKMNRYFIELNSKYWKNCTSNSECGYILVENLQYDYQYIPAAGRIVKSLEEETSCSPIVLFAGFFLFRSHKKIYESFNIHKYIYNSFFISPFILFKAFKQTVKFYLFEDKDPSKLLQLKYENIFIGDLIYDTILRELPNTYTIKKFRFKYLFYIFSAFLYYFRYSELFERFNIKYVYISHTTYIKFGLLARIANSLGRIVIVADRKHIKVYNKTDNIRECKFTPKLDYVEYIKTQAEKIIPIVDNYLNARFLGNINHHDVINAYKDKRIYSKEEIKNQLKIENENPLVVIFPHIFSDDAHATPFEHSLFRDYYDWFDKTLQIIANLKDINWIIKPHPSAKLYNEQNVIEKMVIDLKSDNIFLTPNDLNTSSVINFADVVLTAQGTFALEFSCFGGPSIITAKAKYSGYSISIEPKTVNEYYMYLHEIRSLQRIPEEKVKLAKLLLWIILINSKTEDLLFSKTNNKNRIAQWEIIVKNMEQYSIHNDLLYKRIKFFLNNDFENMAWYDAEQY